MTDTVHVRAVKRFEALTSPGFRADLEPVSWVVAPLMEALSRPLRRRQRTWKVGVVQRRRSLGRDVWFLLHQEVLPPGTDPSDRMRALADDVLAGRWSTGPGDPAG